jgi:hypothetical protein
MDKIRGGRRLSGDNVQVAELFTRNCFGCEQDEANKQQI